MKNLIVLLLIFVGASCRKESVLTNHPEFVGSWRHRISENEVHFLRVSEDGTGFQEWYENGDFKSDTRNRKWFFKDDYILFGRLAGKKDRESYHVDKYPDVADSSFVSDFDTIGQGVRFMVLDGMIFHD